MSETHDQELPTWNGKVRRERERKKEKIRRENAHATTFDYPHRSSFNIRSFSRPFQSMNNKTTENDNGNDNTFKPSISSIFGRPTGWLDGWHTFYLFFQKRLQQIKNERAREKTLLLTTWIQIDKF